MTARSGIQFTAIGLSAAGHLAALLLLDEANPVETTDWMLQAYGDAHHVQRGSVRSRSSEVGGGRVHPQEHTQEWLADSRASFLIIVFVHSLKNLGFPMVMFIGAIQQIPKEIYESAKIDGAAEGSIFFRITVPMIMSTITTVTILTWIGVFGMFDMIMALHGPAGGPRPGDTSTLATMFYYYGFGQRGAVGFAAAIAVMLFAFLASASILQVVLFSRKERQLS